MVKMTTKVINKLGIHARPASELTLKAKEFSSTIVLKNLSTNEQKEINAKYIMLIMAASIAKDNVIEVSAQGEDQEQAVKAIVGLFELGFSEE